MDALTALAHAGTALAIGLMIGLERERAGHGTLLTAGSRTFALVALAGAVAAASGTAVVVAGLVAVVVLLVTGYVVAARTRTHPDLGTTTEVAAIATYLLGALSFARPELSVPLAVGLLVVLAAKRPLHRFATLVSDRDVTDALRLFVVALVVLPLLPDRPLGPGGVLNPSRIWLLVVVLTVIGWAGYVAVRALGERIGLLVVGFLGGFVSASATTVVLARRRGAAADGTVLPAVLAASVATLVQLVTVVAVVSPGVAVRLLPAAGAGTLALVAEILWLLRRREPAEAPAPAPAPGAPDGPAGGEDDPVARPLSLSATLALAGMLVVLLVLTRLAADVAGGGGVAVVALLGGLADAHASAVAAAGLAGTSVTVAAAVVAVGLALASNTVVKLLLALAVGGRAFAGRLGLLLVVPAAAVAGGVVLGASWA